METENLLQIYCVSLSFPLEEQTLHFLEAGFFLFFVFSPMGIISSRICSFILPYIRLSVSSWGAFLEMPQEGPGPRLPLHSREWPVTHSLATANKNSF